MNDVAIRLLPLLAALAVGAPAQAQTPSGPAARAETPSPLAPIYACADKADAAERLACYDAAVAAVRAQESRSEIVAFDRERVAAVRREAFGFRLPSLPRLSLPGRGAAAAAEAGAGATAQAARAPSGLDEDVEEQTFTVVRVGRSGDRVTIETEAGQVWRLNDAEPLAGAPRPPFRVTIRSATLGSFLMQVEGRNRGYRVRRIQ